MTSPIPQRIDLIGQTTWFLLVVMAAVLSISELAARDTTMNLMAGRLGALRAEYVERSSARLGMVPAVYSYREVSAAASAPQVRAQLAADEQLRQEQALLDRILFIEVVRRDLQGLTAVGGSSDEQSLRNILARYQASSSSKTDTNTSPSDRPGVKASSFLYNPLYLMSSDQLLALAIMSCGAIGALIAMLRSEHGTSGKVLVLGVAAGFVTYLAIKGGKHLFLLQAQGELATFNPYGSAFAGLLAGLFTDKAYALISMLVDEFVDRIKSSSRPKV